MHTGLCKTAHIHVHPVLIAAFLSGVPVHNARARATSIGVPGISIVKGYLRYDHRSAVMDVLKNNHNLNPNFEA